MTLAELRRSEVVDLRRTTSSLVLLSCTVAQARVSLDGVRIATGVLLAL